MPSKKAVNSSPYFKSTSTPTRRSTRAVASASNTPAAATAAGAGAKKRKQPTPSSDTEADLESESEGSDFDDGDESDSDFKKGAARKKMNGKGEGKEKGNKRVKRDDDYVSENDDDEDEEDEEEEEDSQDESRPMKRTVIPLPKLRDEGDVEYKDGRLHENTLLFLRDLKRHNNRDWMRFNDGEFRRAQKDFAAFITELSPLVAEKDFTIPELPAKDIIFRIYRDVRFSKDPTPYKPHFSAAWSRTGNKGPYAAYYFHLEPGNKSLLAGGLWHPESSSLELLRDDIDQNPQGLKQTLLNKNLKRDYFPNLKGKGGEKEVVAAFCEKNKENALKTKPRDYQADHKDIALLRLRDYTLSAKISDEQVVHENFLQYLAELVGSLEPFVTYLNSVVRPDRRRNAPNNNAATQAAAQQNNDSSAEEEDEEEDEEGEE